MDTYIASASLGVSVIALWVSVSSIQERAKRRDCLAVDLMLLTEEFRDTVLMACTKTPERYTGPLGSAEDARTVERSVRAIAKPVVETIDKIQAHRHEMGLLFGPAVPLRLIDIVDCWDAKDLLWRAECLAGMSYPEQSDIDALVDEFFLDREAAKLRRGDIDHLNFDLPDLLSGQRWALVRRWDRFRVQREVARSEA